MSLRFLLRRAVVGIAAAAALPLAAPAIASAASTLTVVPSSQQAGGNPNLATTVGFDTTTAALPAPSSLTVELAPGVLASAAANPACLGAATYTAACKIGGGTVSTNAPVPPTAFDAYLVPPKTAGDLAGVDMTPAGATTPVLAHGEVTVRQLPLTTGAAPGAVVLDLTLDLSTLPSLPGTFKYTGTTLTINGTLNGQPLTRMPTNCTVATPSTLSVTYGTGGSATTQTANASPDVAPTGCSSLTYNPSFAASAVKDTSDPGVAIATDVKQSATDAASKSLALGVPLGTFSPNPAILGIACTVTDVSLCPDSSKVGTATAVSPLLPPGLSISGKVFITVSAGHPGLAIVLTSPFKVVLQGTILLSNPVVTTFANIPDIPLTDLTVGLVGGANAAFTTSCSPAASAITATFVGQNGTPKTAPAPVTVQGCPTSVPAGPPTLGSSSLTGLAAGKPKVKFTVKHGTNAPNIKTISLGALNGGLGLSSKGIVTKKTCTGKGKKRKCKTTTTVKGLSLSGATIASVKLSGGKLVITLKQAAASASVTVSGPLLTETKALLKKAKKNKAKGLKGTVGVTDAAGKSTSLALKLS